MARSMYFKINILLILLYQILFDTSPGHVSEINRGLGQIFYSIYTVKKKVVQT